MLDGVYRICQRCDEEHPRYGGYSFEGGHVPSTAERNSHDGNGNRRRLKGIH
jgi:hypothetical protein